MAFDRWKVPLSDFLTTSTPTFTFCVNITKKVFRDVCRNWKKREWEKNGQRNVMNKSRWKTKRERERSCFIDNKFQSRLTTNSTLLQLVKSLTRDLKHQRHSCQTWVNLLNTFPSNYSTLKWRTEEKICTSKSYNRIALKIL